jgi:hypothetical protein
MARKRLPSTGLSYEMFVRIDRTRLHDDEAYNFNLDDLLGEACLLNVVRTEKGGNTYANIQGASLLPKGMTAPELVNETRSLDINTIP